MGTPVDVLPFSALELIRHVEWSFAVAAVDQDRDGRDARGMGEAGRVRHAPSVSPNHGPL